MLRNLKPAMLAFTLVAILFPAQAQKDNLKKNTKIAKKEEARYQEDLKANPNSAEPHWRHAKIVGAFTFSESEEAWKFYLQALEIDSTNAAIWNDYGDYLVDVLGEPHDALYMYQRAIELEPNNDALKEKATNLEKKIELARETARLRSLGYTDKRKVDHGLAYKVIANFDSLRVLTANPESPYHYDKLLARFLEDDPLNEWETYLLMLGFTKTKNYSPYGRPAGDIQELNRNGNYDETIEKGPAALAAHPLSPALYRELMYAYRRKGDNETADRYQRRAQRIYEGIIFTGDGTCTKPYVVLSTDEEYGLLAYMGFYYGGAQALMSCAGSHADRLSLDDENDKEAALFFNVGLLFEKMSEVFGEKK